MYKILIETKDKYKLYKRRPFYTEDISDAEWLKNLAIDNCAVMVEVSDESVEVF